MTQWYARATVFVEHNKVFAACKSQVPLNDLVNIIQGLLKVFAINTAH